MGAGAQLRKAPEELEVRKASIWGREGTIRVEEGAGAKHPEAHGNTHVPGNPAAPAPAAAETI